MCLRALTSLAADISDLMSSSCDVCQHEHNGHGLCIYFRHTTTEPGISKQENTDSQRVQKWKLQYSDIIMCGFARFCQMILCVTASIGSSGAEHLANVIKQMTTNAPSREPIMARVCHLVLSLPNGPCVVRQDQLIFSYIIPTSFNKARGARVARVNLMAHIYLASSNHLYNATQRRHFHYHLLVPRALLRDASALNACGVFAQTRKSSSHSLVGIACAP